MRMSSRRAQLFLVVTLGAAGCLAACGSDDASTFGNGQDGGDGTGDGSLVGDGQGGFQTADGGASFASLYFDPATATINVDGTGAKTVSYSLKGKKADGSVVDVTAESIAFDHPGIATVTAAEPAVATANGPYGGSGQIHAVYRGQSATATLNVHVSGTDIGTGVSAGAVAALNGVTATAPNDPSNTSGKLLYPYDATVFPLGLSTPTLQWTGTTASNVYRLHYEEKNYSFDGYYPSSLVAAKMQLAQAKWDQITASNDAATAPDPLNFKLYRYDGTNAYLDASEAWTMAPASVNGAIYYWSTSNGGGLTRIQPGAGSVPTAIDNGKCMGCHGVSSDGTTLVASVETGESTYRSWVSYNLTSGATPATRNKDSNMYGGNIAVNHNGKYIVFGGKEGSPPTPSTSGLHLGDPTTGLEVTGSGVDAWPMSTAWTSYEYLDPAFSPSGTKLATVLADNSLGSWVKSELFVADFNETAHAFTGLKSLLRYDNALFTSAQWAIGYPSMTPDDNFIAFHVADHGAGCFNDPQGNNCNAATHSISSLYMISAAGGTPIKLNNLNDSSLNTNDHNESFEPTFNPVERGGYYWVVFSSERTWGNQHTTYGTSGDKRLWVAAIDKTIGTIDPSHPPFYLEGQVANTTNMRGFWALAACTATGATGPDGGAACVSGFECCSGFCDSGKCVDVTQVACKALGGSCTQASDCCNSDIVSCTGGTCQEPVR